MSNTDLPFITDRLKILDRQKKREYRKHKKSDKYLKLKSEYDELFRKTSKQYFDNLISKLLECKPGQAYSLIKQLGARPGETNDRTSFNLPSHVENGLSAQQSANKIAAHFAAVSQEYSPIDVSRLPPAVQVKLSEQVSLSEVPRVSEYQVWEVLSKIRAPKSWVPGEIPGRLIKEFSPELAFPISIIFNDIIETGQWPNQWKTEIGVPLGKNSAPKSEDEIRVLSLTPLMSKTFEKFVIQWLLEFVGEKIDQRQFGGKKKVCTTHYLIELTSFILYNWDLTENHAIIATMIDFQKAFNRINHNLIVTKLAELSVPGWLLKIVIGFLKDRKMQVKFNGSLSDLFNMPGGGPQGTLLGMLLFIILINPINFSEDLNWGETITEKVAARSPINQLHFKYFDDLTLAESIKLKGTKIQIDDNQILPANYHDRTGHKLIVENCDTQTKLNQINAFTRENEMVINTQKTKVMLFNKSKRIDFTPNLSIVPGESLETVDEIKLLGVKITPDLKWKTHVEYICKRAFTQLWSIRRLKKLGASKDILLDMYMKQVRSITEYAAPVWSFNLTAEEIGDIESGHGSLVTSTWGRGYCKESLSSKYL